jgi:hypothetical protein
MAGKWKTKPHPPLAVHVRLSGILRVGVRLQTAFYAAIASNERLLHNRSNHFSKTPRML